MGMKTFIENFAEQLDETDIDLLEKDTKFKELEEWSSMTALALIAMVDENYNVKLKGDDIKNSNTLEDLFNVIKAK